MISPEQVGNALFRALLDGRVRDSFVGSLGRTAVEADRGLALRLIFDLTQPEVAPLAALPWELLYDAATRDFLARNRRTPVVRFLDLPRSTLPPPLEPPLALVAIAASPAGTTPLALASERQRLTEA